MDGSYFLLMQYLVPTYLVLGCSRERGEKLERPFARPVFDVVVPPPP